MAVVSMILLLIALLLLVMTGLWCLEVLLGLSRGDPPAIISLGQPSSFALAILIPAHNEEAGIAETLKSLSAQLGKNDLILVVADNCDDRTAEVVRNHGATVIERTEPELRGKSYALAFGIDYLNHKSNVDGVVVVDADCEISEGGINIIRSRLQEAQIPLQCVYLIKAPDGHRDKPNLLIAEFAGRIKNDVRARGLQRLGAPVHLTGTGMAFPWSSVADINFASGTLAEDMDLGLELAARGIGASFLPQVTVSSVFPVGEKSLGTQRKRWIHGQIEVMLKTAPQVIWQSIRRRDLGALMLGIDTMIPPFFFLYAMNLVFTVVLSPLAIFVFDSVETFAMLLTSLVLISLTLCLAAVLKGRDLLGWHELVRVFPFGLRMIREVISGVFKRETAWVRTERDNINPTRRPTDREEG